MHVIANRGAVRGIVVGAENPERGRLAESRADGERNEMRFGRVVLPDFSVGIGSCGIEITKAGVTQSVCACVPAQDLLDEQLRFAVRTDRSLRVIFGDRQFVRYAVSRARRR